MAMAMHVSKMASAMIGNTRRGMEKRNGRMRRGKVRATQEEREEETSNVRREMDKDTTRIAFEPKAKKRTSRTRSTAEIRTPTKDAASGKDGAMPVEYQLEAAGVAVLVLLFATILLGGIFLGASAFLSEDLDRFAQDVVYPNYSKVVVAFLLGSTAYGFYKSR